MLTSEELRQLKSCPFCGSKELDYSFKVSSRRGKTSDYHCSIFCNKCHCYGKRVLVHINSRYRFDIENDRHSKELAMQAWNDRV